MPSYELPHSEGTRERLDVLRKVVGNQDSESIPPTSGKAYALLAAYRDPQRESRKQAFFMSLEKDPRNPQDIADGNLSQRDFERLGKKFELDVNRPTTPQVLLNHAKRYAGYTYLLGAKGENNQIDCSGLITQCLAELGAAKGAWTSAHNLYLNATIIKQPNDSPDVGDLVFWVNKEGTAKHVAIVNQVLESGKVRITQSSASGGGYSESEIIDLNKGPAKKGSKFAFGRPVFYG